MITDKKILSLAGLKKLLDKKPRQQKIVLAAGSFDIIHAGHLLFLDFAKRQGDLLIVCVGSDAVLKSGKGPTRPLLPERLRLRLIAGFEVVDYVTLLDEDYSDGIGLKNTLTMLQPDIWVYSYESRNQKARVKLAISLGIKIILNPRIRPNRIKTPLSSTYIERLLKSETGKM